MLITPTYSIFKKISEPKLGTAGPLHPKDKNHAAAIFLLSQ